MTFTIQLRPLLLLRRHNSQFLIKPCRSIIRTIIKPYNPGGVQVIFVLVRRKDLAATNTAMCKYMQLYRAVPIVRMVAVYECTYLLSKYLFKNQFCWENSML